MKRAMQFFQTPVEWASLGLDPIAFQLGSFALRWYSLAYIAGIISAWVLLTRMARHPGSPMTAANVDDLITWAALGVILGGRMGYVFFYNPAQYLHNPLDIVKLWEGGMSSHGGFIGVILATWLYTRSQKLQTLRVLDYVAVVTPIGLMLGRLANFVNGELWGRPTDGSWGIIFPDAGPEPRHPSTLYHAMFEGLLPLIVLMGLFWFTRARMRPGQLAGTFLLMYGVSRFGIEYFREPDAQLGVLSTGLTMGQTLTLPLIAIALYLLATLNRRQPAPLPNPA
jgi:phosphatidylglycerol---prolipoprotein diacylglyceryl transferase